MSKFQLYCATIAEAKIIKNDSGEYATEDDLMGFLRKGNVNSVYKWYLHALQDKGMLGNELSKTASFNKDSRQFFANFDIETGDYVYIPENNSFGEAQVSAVRGHVVTLSWCVTPAGVVDEHIHRS